MPSNSKPQTPVGRTTFDFCNLPPEMDLSDYSYNSLLDIIDVYKAELLNRQNKVQDITGFEDVSTSFLICLISQVNKELCSRPM